ncbi:MAG: hypothetical protein LKI53_03405 [Bacteroidales bacterium]|jgi:predicted secreted protein|nr:hypothetical protein [Bacteroidales bacterium]
MNNSEKKIIIVPHCLMTRGFSSPYKNDMGEVLNVLVDSGTGVIQIPCPHLLLLRNIGPETECACTDYDSLFRLFPRKTVINIYSDSLSPFIMQAEDYKNHGFEVIGFIGIRGSSACDVKNATGRNVGGNGLYMRILKDELNKKGIHPNMANIDIRTIKSKVKRIKHE